MKPEIREETDYYENSYKSIWIQRQSAPQIQRTIVGVRAGKRPGTGTAPAPGSSGRCTEYNVYKSGTRNIQFYHSKSNQRANCQKMEQSILCADLYGSCAKHLYQPWCKLYPESHS